MTDAQHFRDRDGDTLMISPDPGGQGYVYLTTDTPGVQISPEDLPKLITAIYQAAGQDPPVVLAGPAYINADDGYKWLTCGNCEESLVCLDGGETLADLNDAVTKHTCTADDADSEAGR